VGKPKVALYEPLVSGFIAVVSFNVHDFSCFVGVFSVCRHKIRLSLSPALTGVIFTAESPND